MYQFIVFCVYGSGGRLHMPHVAEPPASVAGGHARVPDSCAELFASLTRKEDCH